MSIRKVVVMGLASVFTLGITSSVAVARQNACGKEMTATELAERALDVQEIQNVMGMHQILGSPGGDHDREIELYWAQQTPGVTFAHNRGIYTGIDTIRKYYGTGKGVANDPQGEQSGAPMMIGGAGNMAFRMLTTPIIEIAGDGKTAKGFWYTPGFQSTIMNGQGNAIWSYEKYAIDFVREDGKWKIWHFRVNNDWEVPMGKDLAQFVLERARNNEQMPTPPPPREDLAKDYKDTVFNEAYSADKMPNPMNPRPPEPYCTFSDTFSYGHAE